MRIHNWQKKFSNTHSNYLVMLRTFLQPPKQAKFKQKQPDGWEKQKKHTTTSQISIDRTSQYSFLVVCKFEHLKSRFAKFWPSTIEIKFLKKTNLKILSYYPPKLLLNQPTNMVKFVQMSCLKQAPRASVCKMKDAHGMFKKIHLHFSNSWLVANVQMYVCRYHML
jgi:hypothetical protein